MLGTFRISNWKLLMNPDGSRKELYDIPNDPSEVNNKMDVQAELGNRLTEKLSQWFSLDAVGSAYTIPHRH